jgi:hypothetical protein
LEECLSAPETAAAKCGNFSVIGCAVHILGLRYPGAQADEQQAQG